MINELLTLLRDATMTLPALELSLLLISLTFCLVLGFSRTGLIIAYLFTYRWGWIFFMGKKQEFLVAYVVFGIIAGALAVVGLLRSPSED